VHVYRRVPPLNVHTFHGVPNLGDDALGVFGEVQPGEPQDLPVEQRYLVLF
jgi:hypothetical protein